MIRLVQELLNQKHYALAKSVKVAFKNEPSVHFSSKDVHISINSYKSVDTPVTDMLDLTPNREQLIAKLDDIHKLQTAMAKEISERIMKIQDTFESLVEGVAIDAADEYNKRMAKLFE